jgi:hypothetical protein
MAVFIELSTEPFEDNMRKYAAGTPGINQRAGITSARRPLRGIEVKTDTYAMIQVIRSDGSVIPLVDQATPDGLGGSTSSFLIQTAQEARMEKHQIIETFGEPYIYFFGESPRFLDVQAILINTNDFNWEAEWWDNWDNRIRGTKAVEQGARTYLFYDDTVVEGYMLMAQAIKTSEQPWTVQLSWRMYITNYRNISFVGDPNFPLQANVDLPPDIDLTGADAFDQLTSLYQNESRTQQALANRDQSILDAAHQAGAIPNSIGVTFGPGGVTTAPLQAPSPASFGGVRKMSDLIRTGIRSTAFAPDVGALIASLSENDPASRQALQVFNTLTSRPIRSKIVDNTDEWTGSGDFVDTPADGLPSVFTPYWRSVQESQNLFLDAIRWMSCFGADMNDHESLADIGLRVSFSPNGVSIKGGINTNSIGATFSPRFSNYAGTLPPSVGANTLVVNQNTTINPYAQPVTQDLFFGNGVRAGTSVGLDGVSLGYQYGYPSPYGGPGYGIVGYGDQDGIGYGSGFGQVGDPGHIQPGRFTFAGVEDNQSAFDRFVRPTLPQGPQNGIGLGVSSSGGVGVGASIRIGGRPSAFGMGVAPGTLTPDMSCGAQGGLGVQIGGGVGLTTSVQAGASIGLGVRI